MLKNLFKKDYDKDLRYDFLPTELEIIEKPASPLGKIIIYVIAVFIILIIVIACIAKIDVTVISDGQVSPVEGIKTVDSNLNGKISKICKAEGDKVYQGEEILEIENNNEQNKEAELKNNMEIDKLQRDLINFRIDGYYDEAVFDNYNINDDKKKEIKMQYDLETENNDKENDSYNKSINEIDENENKLKKDIDSIQKQYNSMKDDEKNANGNNLLSEISSKNDEMKDLEKKRNEYKDSIASKRNQKKLEYIQQKNKLDIEIDNLQNSLDAIENQKENYVIKSPIDGIILTCNYNTLNSYVNQSRPIAEIVPSDTDYEVEAYVATKDISRIKEGQEVVIKLEGYDYQKYGTIRGEVYYISPNSFNDEKRGIVYKVKIKFDKNENENINVMPGMGASIEIKSDKIRLIEYFLEPFQKNFDNALKG